MTPIPILRLVRAAYLDLIANWRGMVQVGALWLVLPWVLHTLDGGFLALLGDLALTAGIAAIAVAWHRRILLDEALPRQLAPLNGNVARYLGFSVLIVMLAAAPSILLALLLAGALLGGEGAEGPGLLLAVLLTVAAVLSLIAAMRLQLVFPAAAINERSVTLGASWQATRGNGWRLLGGILLVSLPPAAVGTLLAYILGGLSAATGSLVLGWLARLAPIAGAWLQAPLLAAFLSYVYLFLRQGPPGALVAVPADGQE